MTDTERQDELYEALLVFGGVSLAKLWEDLSRLKRMLPKAYPWVPESREQLASDLRALAVRGLCETSGGMWLWIPKRAERKTEAQRGLFV